MMIKRTLPYYLALTMIGALGMGLLSSCSKKQEDMTPVNPGETRTYKDNVFNFSFKAPKAWVVEPIPGRSTFVYSSASTETRFQKFTEGDYGARVGAGVLEHTTIALAVDEFKQSIDGVTFAAPTPVTIAGQPGMKVDYSVTGDNGLNGYRIFTNKDSLVTFFDAASFGPDRMKKYAPVFQIAEKSFVPGFAMTMKNGKLDSASMQAMMESMQPSDAFVSYDGKGFSIQYPDNFHVNSIAGGVEIAGERTDAVIRVGTLQAPKGVDLAAFVAENVKAYSAYHASAPQNLTLAGHPAKMISYAPGAASARAYFVMNGQAVYRITITWPQAQESAFRPAFEKAVQSFKLK